MSTQPSLEELKAEAERTRREAEKAAYAYFCACDIGPERERAHAVYTNILYAKRIR